MKTLLFPSNRSIKTIATAILLILSILAINAVAQRSSSEKDQVTSNITESKQTSWMRTELYYGAGRLPHDGKPDERWENYINNEVTPRFPEGLTLLEGTGQWRVEVGEKPRRNRTRILILIHEATEEKSRMVEEIQKKWIEISGHQAVLRVSQPAEVSM